MVKDLTKVFLLFIIYSFGGWLTETIYCSYRKGSFVERGFLKGPLCPIYGFGAMAVLLFANHFKSNTIILFFSSIIITSGIEYITSYGLEKLFGIKLWGYSHRKFNIKGRVCLRNSLMFGVLSVLFIKIIHPIIERIIDKIDENRLSHMSKFLGLYFIIDTAISIMGTLDIKVTLRNLKKLQFI